MDQRGVPIVNRSIYETPKRSNGVFRRTSYKRSSPFSFRQDISLLEAYDQFSDACFQSNLRSPNLKSPSRLELNLRQLHLTSQRDLPHHRSGEYRRRRDDREINKILQAFPKLANYYKLLTRVGQGTFSKVYKALDLYYDLYVPRKKCKAQRFDGRQYVAIKILYETSSPKRISDEVSYLAALSDAPCITSLIAAFRHEATTYIVLPYINYDDFDSMFYCMKMDDIKCYFYDLFTGLKHTHALGVVHRDIKPSNFLYHSESKTGYLADFGLAQKQTELAQTRQEPFSERELDNLKVYTKQPAPGYYTNDTRRIIRAHRAGTRGFRAPEIMLRFVHQTTAIDIWSVGVMLLICLSGCYPYFEAQDDADALVEFLSVFGTKKMKACAAHYGRRLHFNIPTLPKDPIPLHGLCLEANRAHIESWNAHDYDNAIHLLEMCFQLNHIDRITADQAIQHPFFHDIASIRPA